MSFLSRIFQPPKYINCPRCLAAIQVSKNPVSPNVSFKCSDCRYEIPFDYVNGFQDAYPVFIQLFGWSSVGKTTFLDVLRLMLYDAPWPSFTCEPITTLDFEHKKVLLEQRLNGMRPDSTQKRERDKNEPYIMRLNNMHRWQSRFLVMMDHAGEQFEAFTVPQGEIPFLQHCPTTIMLYSLSDQMAGKRIEDVMTTYIKSLTHYGVDFNKTPRKLVVVLAKGDRIANLPANIMNYLSTDETWTLLQKLERPPYLQGEKLSEYIEVMTRVSDTLKDWLEKKVPGAQQFLNMAADKRIDVRFSIVSAQGQEINAQTSATQISPKRVLDPFFWALEFQSK